MGKNDTAEKCFRKILTEPEVLAIRSEIQMSLRRYNNY
jgi:hypothetical protein